MPVRGLGVGFTGGTFGSGNFGQLKPGMTGEKLHQALADDTGGAENSGAEFLAGLELRRTHAAPRGLEL